MAESYELNINQGANLELPFILKDESGSPLNLTGYTARMQLRSSYTATTFALELTTANNRIVITPLEGKLTLTLDAATTATLPAQRYVYDIELVSASGFVSRIVQGECIVSPEVTR